MHRYAMKAAGCSRTQLGDRVGKFEKLGLEPLIELHLMGLNDILDGAPDIKRNCMEYGKCDYIVHFPVTDAKTKYIFDMYNDEDHNLEKAFDLCESIDARTLVLHRCFGFDMGLNKADSKEKFFDKVSKWNLLSADRGIKILFENYGFVWLPNGMGKDFVVSPLDHFFPWEIKAFNDRLRDSNLSNIGLLLDIAHLAISANMFNMVKAHPELRFDRRFGAIFQDDANKADLLKIEDSVFDFVDHFHISDSFVWNKTDGLGDMRKFLYSEGLAIGSGNIDFGGMFKNVSGDKIFIMEIEPKDGDYGNNTAQLEAIGYFMKMFARRGKRHVFNHI